MEPKSQRAQTQPIQTLTMTVIQTVLKSLKDLIQQVQTACHRSLLQSLTTTLRLRNQLRLTAASMTIQLL